ncbi:hypothetical protein SAMN05216571_101228 [Onishia taeanensis]|uniref:Prophage PssSM-02 n=1 Tax=Onishia taeanensis TaxID=284577 RepID=A0A1G7N4Y5_9GAMM|nr:hypothetical protein [Halomonas taeanensis]SDF69022.1 hypothetical protein SAMN05216571_101228 [Halomonas taeanensis]
MSDQPTTTQFADLLPDMDAGVFAEKIGRALSDVAAGVVQTGKAGKVNITLDLKQIADSRQVDVAHKLSYVQPTAKGKRSEENTTKTPLYVGRGGKLSLFPENQGKFEFDSQEQRSTQGA